MTDGYYYVGLARQQDLIREAQKEREARLAIQESKHGNVTLAWMGRRLTNIGNHLITVSGENN